MNSMKELVSRIEEESNIVILKGSLIAVVFTLISSIVLWTIHVVNRQLGTDIIAIWTISLCALCFGIHLLIRFKKVQGLSRYLIAIIITSMPSIVFILGFIFGTMAGSGISLLLFGLFEGKKGG